MAKRSSESSGNSELLIDCATPNPISNLGEDFLRILVITGQDIPIIVVKCAKVKEEGSPEFSQGERREILAATVCDLGTLFK